MTTDRFETSILRQAILLLVVLKIVAVTLTFDPAGLQAFDLPKTLVGHALAWLLAGCLLFTVRRFGTAVIPRTRLHLFVVMFLAANVAAAVVAPDQYLAAYGEQGRYLGLTFLLDMTILYLAVAIAFRSIADLAILGVGTAVTSLVCMSYAAVQYVGADPIAWSGDATRIGSFGGPPFGTLGQFDVLGHFISATFAVALAVTFAPIRRIYRLAGVAFILLALASAFAVGSRGSALGIAAAVVALVLTSFRERGVRYQPRRFALFAILAIATLASVVIVLANARESDAWQGPGSGRLRLYESAVLAFSDRPLLGYGPDAFAVAYPKYRLPTLGLPSDAQTSAHNWLLQAAVTTGAVGLAALMALVAAAAWMAWVALPRTLTARVVFLCLAAYWANALVATGAVAVDWIPWTGFGLLAAISAPTRGRINDQHRNSTSSSVVIVIAVLLGALSGLAAFAANESAGSARSALAEGRGLNAIDYAQMAVTTDPGRAEYWNWLGLALEADSRWPDAAAAYAEAARRARHEPTYWSNLALALAHRALIETRADLTRDAMLAAQTGIDADPTSWRANEVLAQVAAAFKEDDIAIEAAVATIILEKGNESSEAIAVDAAGRLRDPFKAQRLLESALEVKETAPLHVALGKLALGLSDRPAAYGHALRALVLDPASAEAATLLSASR